MSQKRQTPPTETPVPLRPGQQIFYHVGLGKAASTYLQKSVFPVLTGVHYVHRNRYRSHPKIVPTLDANKILLSRENSQRLEAETGRLARYYPDAIPIIVLRRHDGWAASQYRRYVKNGGVESFTEFLDLDQDQGVWKQSEFLLLPKLEILERHFGKPPAVLNYETMRENPYQIVDEVCALMGADYRSDDIDVSPRHRSWSDQQLLFLRRYNVNLFSKDAKPDAGSVRRWLRFRSRLLTSYSIMGVAKFARTDRDETLIDRADLKRIRAHFEDDWQSCMDYADRHNPPSMKTVPDTTQTPPTA